MSNMLPIYEAFKMWWGFHHKSVCTYEHEMKRPFGDFLGGYKGSLGDLSSWKLTPDGEAKVQYLLGPHARTILKAYFATHPELPKPPYL